MGIRQGQSPFLLNQAVVAKNRYDQNGRLVERQAADGITRYFYDLTGNVTRQEQRGNQNDSDGNKTRVTETGYDALGRAIIQRTPQFHGINQALGQTLVELNPLTKQTLDRWGNALTRTDQAGFTTHYVYNHDNQIIEERLPTFTAVKTNDKAYQANVVHEIHYNLQGLVAETVDRVEDDPNTAAGDSQANEARTLRTRKNHYNQLGQLTASIDATNIRTDYVYDASGNRVGSKDALGHVFVETYNANGQVTGKSVLRIKRSEQVTHPPRYDDEAGVWLPGGTVTQVSYLTYTGQSFEPNPSSQVTQELVAVTLSTSSYDTAGRKIADGDGLGHQRYYKLDERGNVVEARSAAGISTHSRYNEFGQKLSELDALNNGSQYRYNLATGDNFGFGQTLTMTVGQNRTTSYQYNEFGQLAGESYSFQTGSRSYSYHGNGLLQSIVDVSSKGTPGIDGGIDYLETQVTMRYDYTIRGEKALESYTTIRHQDVGNYHTYFDRELGRVVQDLINVQPVTLSTQKTTLVSYDALGRVELIKTPTADAQNPSQNANRGLLNELRYAYDELGNRRKISSNYSQIDGSTRNQAHWYTYDLEGRLTISKGMMFNDQIVAYEGGVAIAYDNLGRRLGTSSYTGTRTSNIPGEPVSTYHQFDQERYFYDELGQLTGIDKRLHERLVLNASHYRNDVDVTDSGWKLSNRREYDGRGYVSKNIDFDDNGAFKGRTETSYLADGRTLMQAVYDQNEKLSGRVLYNQPGAYDAAGNLTRYQYEMRAGDNSVSMVYTYDYTYTTEFGGYKEKTVLVSADRGGSSPGATHNYYDHKGQLFWQTVQDGSTYIQRGFSYDGEGHILTKSETRGTANAKQQDYFYANGQAVGSIGGLSDAEFDYNYTPVSAKYPSSSPGQYVINSGDTLAGIAQMVFGDAKLWYLIADANSLQVGQHDALSDVGKTLKIPNVISNIHNDSTTFKPYNPSEIIGDTTPSPIPPPPPANKCGGLAMLVMVVVAVIVTVFTAGAAGPAMIAAFGQLGGAMAAGFVAGAAGSIASQAVGKAMGVVDHFSLRQAVSSGVAGALTAGVGSALSSTAQTSTTFATQVVEGGKVVGTTLTGLGQGIQGAASVAAQYLGNKAAGLDASFSWKSVAAGFVSGYAQGALELNGIKDPTTGAPQTANLWTNFTHEFANSAIRATTQRVMGVGGKQDWKQIAIDSFGNALGNSLSVKYDIRGHGEAFGLSFTDEYQDLSYVQIRQGQNLAKRFGLDLSKKSARQVTANAASYYGSHESSDEARWGALEAIYREVGLDDASINQVKDIYKDKGLITEYTGNGSGSHYSGPERLKVSDRYVQKPAFGSSTIDGMLIGAGEVADHVTRFIGENPTLGYALYGLDVIAGPAAFAVREAVAASPVGEWIETAKEKALDFVADEFREVDYRETDAVNGGGGAFTLLSLAAGGGALLLRKISDSGFLRKVDEAKLRESLELEQQLKMQTDYEMSVNAGKTPLKRKNFQSLEELNSLKGTGKNVGNLSKVSGASVQEIIENIPESASVRKLTPKEGGSQVGLEYKWVDDNGVTNRLRVHDPDPSAGTGSNSAEGWTARWQSGGQYFDPIENDFRHRNVHNTASPYYDPSAANNTHIPIKTPESWLVDLMRPN